MNARKKRTLLDDYDVALAHEGTCDAGAVQRAFDMAATTRTTTTTTTTAADRGISRGVAMSTNVSEAEPTEAEAGPSTPQNHENDATPTPSTASIPICPLCCDDDLTPTAAVVLSACRHRSCGACLVRWMESEESSGRSDTGPTCPFCRVAICEGDVTRILGRPFHPRTGSAVHEATVDDVIDELTLHWINQNTVPCAFCGFRIEKEDGCDLMECLCGYRFCYKCGAAGGVCNCNPGHMFLSDLEGFIGAPIIRDENGQVDLPLCIRRRDVRRDRLNRWYEGLDHWQYSEYFPSVCTFNGRWLFSSKRNSRCIAMLTHQLENERISYERFENYDCRDCDWQDSAECPSVCTFNGRWLFSSKGNSRCIAMLTQQLEHERVRGERAANRNLEIL